MDTSGRYIESGGQMTIRNLKWLDNGPRRLDVDTILLVVGVTQDTYPETFNGGNLVITTGGGLHEGQYLAADATTLEEMEIGVIFRDQIPRKTLLLSQLIPGETWITGEVVGGKFLVQDMIAGDRRLLGDERKKLLTELDLDLLEDQFLGYH